MFCPEGYVAAVTVAKIFYKHAMKNGEKITFYQRYRKLWQDVVSEMRERGYQRNGPSGYSDFRLPKNIVFTGDLIDRVAVQKRANSAFIAFCSSISVHTFVGPNAEIALLDEAVLEREKVSYLHSKNFTGYGFVFIEEGALTLSLQRYYSLKEHAEALIAYLNRPVGGSTFTPTNHKLKEACRKSDIANVLKALDGYAMAFSKEIIPDEKGLDEFMFGKRASAKKIGRPSLIESALEYYNECFPNGHKTYTWKEMAKIIEVECGFSASVDTYKRALGWKSKQN